VGGGGGGKEEGGEQEAEGAGELIPLEGEGEWGGGEADGKGNGCGVSSPAHQVHVSVGCVRHEAFQVSVCGGGGGDCTGREGARQRGGEGGRSRAEGCLDRNC